MGQTETPEQIKDQKIKRKFLRFLISRKFFMHIGIMIVLTVVLIFGTFFILDIYTGHGQAISVPDFTGMTLKEVDKIIKEKNLDFVVIDSVYGDEVARGTVVNQEPKPDQKVKKHRKIYLTINAVIPQQIPMPNFIDLEPRAALALSETYGLSIGEKTFVPSQFPTILKQLYKGKEITPGTMIPKGSVIDLVIGRGTGSEKVIVPNIIGLTYQEAENKLTQLSLNIGAVIPDETIITPEDTLNSFVYKQKPVHYEDNEIRVGEFIDVWISTNEKLLPDSIQNALKEQEEQE
ncbi:MAG: PASTA domain-containing protein [Marinilabiliales bacterium]